MLGFPSGLLSHVVVSLDEFVGAIGVDTGGLNSVGGDLSGVRACEGFSVVIDSTECLSVSNSEESSKDD